jgi:hypothetical protein
MGKDHKHHHIPQHKKPILYRKNWLRCNTNIQVRKDTELQRHNNQDIHPKEYKPL